MTQPMDSDEGYDVPHPLWKSENRVHTFNSWGNQNVSIESLAKAGFRYEGPGDKVKCVFCYLMIDNWQPGDIPYKKHRELRPDCPHIEYLQEPVPESDRNIIRQHARIPSYENLDIRRKTFENWPIDNPKPDDLAKAGFYYTKRRDQVQCFYCSLYVEQWEPQDDAFVEHCRLNPKCPYMFLYKGPVFVQQCNPGATATEPSIDPSELATNVEVMRDTLTFQGFGSIYIDTAFLQQKIKGAAPFMNSESLYNAIQKLPGAEDAASARLKDPNKTNPAEIALMKACKICLQHEWKFIALPCRHFTCCNECKNEYPKCPICDRFVNYKSIDVDTLGQNLSDLDL